MTDEAPAPAELPAALLSETVTKIERELGAIWGAPDEDTGLPKVRASTLNLAVVAAGSEIDHQREQTDALAATHAGRVFLVSGDGHIAPWAIDYDVSGVCRPGPDGTAPICNDRVELRCGAMVSARVHSVVGALALPEVPLVVDVARGAPRKLTDALASACDRLVVDSAHTSLTRIGELVSAVSVPVTDRAFIRMYTWRELSARLFDDALEALASVERLEVVSTGESPDRTHLDPSHLMVGWIASRLGWRFDGPRTSEGEGVTARVARRPDGQAVRVTTCRREVGGLGPGELVAIGFETTERGSALTLRCERVDGSRVVTWRRTGTRSDEHEHALGFRDEAWVLARAIDTAEGAAVYREAALAAASWASS